MLFRDTIFTKHRRVVLCVRNAVETCNYNLIHTSYVFEL